MQILQLVMFINCCIEY